MDSILARNGSEDRKKAKRDKTKDSEQDIKQINHSGVNAYGNNIKNLLKSKAEMTSQLSIDSDNILQSKDLLADGKLQIQTPQSSIPGLNAKLTNSQSRGSIDLSNSKTPGVAQR